MFTIRRFQLAAAVHMCLLLCLLSTAATASPLVTGVSSPASVGLYQRFEAGFDVTTIATNYFWPYDESPNAGVPAKVGVTVDGLFSKDGWQTTTVQPAFYCQDYAVDPGNPARLISQLRSWAYPSGSARWKLRFAPTSVGTWQFKIRVTDASGTYTSSAGSFNCTESASRGFVRVSTSDRRYFETSDGTHLPLVGVGGFQRNIPDAQTDYPALNAMGINIVRPWWQGSWGWTGLFGSSGQGGDSYWHNLVLDSTVVQPGHLVSAKLSGNVSLWTSVPVKPSTSYRMTAVIKTVGLVGTGTYGVRLKGINASAALISADSDWTTVTYDFTTGASNYELLLAGVETFGLTSGTAYVSSISVRENLGGGTYGPELFSRPDFQSHNHYPQDIAFVLDKMVESAEANRIYMKVVIEEKQDGFFGCIQSDGTWGARSDNNVYATPTHASRTYQQYYWRYLIARYGYSTAIHSFELFNEADPFSTANWESTAAFGDFVKRLDPNKHLVTSSNWHSYPPPMWMNSNLDYSDIHMYIGGAPFGSRWWAGWDGEWTVPNSATSETDYGTGFAVDGAVAHSGNQSLRMSLPADPTASSGFVFSNLGFQVGLKFGHQIRISFWAKAQDYVAQATWAGAHLYTAMQETGADWVSFTPGSSQGRLTPASGTYDWQKFSWDFTVTNARWHILSVKPRYYGNYAAYPGTVWIDDVLVEDLTTGEVLNYNGGFENMQCESYDVVAARSAYAQLTRTYPFDKPAIRGESSLCQVQRFGTPYRGFNYTGEDQLVVDDTSGVWWKKWVWSSIHPGALTELYWYTDELMSRKFSYAKAYRTFMSGIPLSNGNYKDVAATVSDPVVRVLGQKDLTNNRAHLWIDNSKYTWKAVVDHYYEPEPWNSTATYALGSTCGSATKDFIYKSKQNSNKNHPLTDTAWWEPVGAFNIANNPALPPPVSGTITVAGLANGPYRVEWWDTSAGTITRTDSVTCVGGNIALAVTNLVSDTACKIYPQPPDTSAPSVAITIPTTSATYSTSGNSVSLGGSAADNAAVSGVSWVNDRGGSGSCTGTTSWSASNVALQSGVNNLTVSASDAAGNVGSATIAVTYNAPDTTAPVVIITSPTSNIGYLTGNDTLSVGGTATDSGGVAKVTWTNSRGGSGTCTGTGSWSASGIKLSVGSNLITITAEDSAGNSGSDSLLVTYNDTTPPTISIADPTSDLTYTTSSKTVNLAGISADNIAVSAVTWSNSAGGSGNCAGTTTWSASSVPLAVGTNVIVVTARDTSGNAASAQLTVTCTAVNPSATTVSITSPTSSSTYSTTGTTVDIAGTASDSTQISSVSWSANGGRFGTCTGTANWTASGIGLDVGSNIITVTARNSSGGTATAMLTVNRALPPDTTKPSVQVLSPTDQTSYSTTEAAVSIAGTASDDRSLQSVNWSNDRGGSGTCTGTDSWSAPGIALAAGTNVITVTARDAAGNTSAVALSVECTRSAGPAVSIVAPTTAADYRTNAKALVLSGTAADTSGISGVTWRTGDGANGTCDGTNSWTSDVIDLATGRNTITVTARNSQGATADAALTVDVYDTPVPDEWQGLAMVSLPIVPTVSDPKIAVGFADNAWFAYEPSVNRYAVYSDDPEHVSWFEPADNTPGRAFWAKFDGHAKVPLGEIPAQDQPASVHLNRGWNLIGPPYLSPVPWTSTSVFVQEPGGLLRPLGDAGDVLEDYAFGWRHDPLDPYKGAYYLVRENTAENLLLPWLGYWVKAYKECDLIFTPN